MINNANTGSDWGGGTNLVGEQQSRWQAAERVASSRAGGA